jgi:hypothetical protein
MPPVYVAPERFMNTVVNWNVLEAGPVPIKRRGCDWINDHSIIMCLAAGRLEDVRAPQTAHSHHASRVASLVTLIRAGVVLDPIHLHIGRKIAIYDGNHRVRAYQFCERMDCVPAKLTGNVKKLRGLAQFA